MKIWFGYGSEHSYNLIMIGHFVDHTKAKAAEDKFKRLADGVAAEMEAGTMDVGWDADERFSDSIRTLLNELKLYDLGPTDVANFAYEHSIEVDGATLRLATDEGEVQGFLKLLINAGARIEVYSRHHWSDAGEPRVD